MKSRPEVVLFFQGVKLLCADGRDEARALLIVLLVSKSRVVIRTSQDDAGKLMDQITSAVNIDCQRQQDLGAMAASPGCLEARRAEGTDEYYLTPFGATLCAVNDQTVALASGIVRGLTGVKASDMGDGLLSGHGS